MCRFVNLQALCSCINMYYTVPLHSQDTNLINIGWLQASVPHDSGSSRVKINIARMKQDKDNARPYICKIQHTILTSRKDHPPGGKPQLEGNHQDQACPPLHYHQEGCLSNKQRSANNHWNTSFHWKASLGVIQRQPLSAEQMYFDQYLVSYS